LLFSSLTSKVLVTSLNDEESFCALVLSMNDVLDHCESPELAKKIQKMMFLKFYYLLSFFVEMKGFQPQEEFMENCLKSLVQKDIQFTNKQINRIFDQLDPASTYKKLKAKFFDKFKRKDTEIESQMEQLQIMIKGQKLDSDEGVQFIDDFDLFAYNDIIHNGKPTNVLVESLNNGYMDLLNYCLEEGPLNVRCNLRCKNKFELLEETSQSHSQIFLIPKRKLSLFKQIYLYLIDILQLRNFLEVFDSIQQNSEVILFLLQEIKFLSLF